MDNRQRKTANKKPDVKREEVAQFSEPNDDDISLNDFMSLSYSSYLPTPSEKCCDIDETEEEEPSSKRRFVDTSQTNQKIEPTVSPKSEPCHDYNTPQSDSSRGISTISPELPENNLDQEMIFDLLDEAIINAKATKSSTNSTNTQSTNCTNSHGFNKIVSAPQDPRLTKTVNPDPANRTTQPDHNGPKNSRITPVTYVFATRTQSNAQPFRPITIPQSSTTNSSTNPPVIQSKTSTPTFSQPIPCLITPRSESDESAPISPNYQPVLQAISPHVAPNSITNSLTKEATSRPIKSILKSSNKRTATQSSSMSNSSDQNRPVMASNSQAGRDSDNSSSLQNKNKKPRRELAKAQSNKSVSSTAPTKPLTSKPSPVTNVKSTATSLPSDHSCPVMVGSYSRRSSSSSIRSESSQMSQQSRKNAESKKDSTRDSQNSSSKTKKGILSQPRSSQEKNGPGPSSDISDKSQLAKKNDKIVKESQIAKKTPDSKENKEPKPPNKSTVNPNNKKKVPKQTHSLAEKKNHQLKCSTSGAQKVSNPSADNTATLTTSSKSNAPTTKNTPTQATVPSIRTSKSSSVVATTSASPLPNGTCNKSSSLICLIPDYLTTQASPVTDLSCQTSLPFSPLASANSSSNEANRGKPIESSSTPPAVPAPHKLLIANTSSASSSQTVSSKLSTGESHNQSQRTGMSKSPTTNQSCDKANSSHVSNSLNEDNTKAPFAFKENGEFKTSPNKDIYEILSSIQKCVDAIKSRSSTSPRGTPPKSQASVAPKPLVKDPLIKRNSSDTEDNKQQSSPQTVTSSVSPTPNCSSSDNKMDTTSYHEPPSSITEPICDKKCSVSVSTAESSTVSDQPPSSLGEQENTESESVNEDTPLNLTENELKIVNHHAQYVCLEKDFLVIRVGPQLSRLIGCIVDKAHSLLMNAFERREILTSTQFIRMDRRMMTILTAAAKSTHPAWSKWLHCSRLYLFLISTELGANSQERLRDMSKAEEYLNPENCEEEKLDSSIPRFLQSENLSMSSAATQTIRKRSRSVATNTMSKEMKRLKSQKKLRAIASKVRKKQHYETIKRYLRRKKNLETSQQKDEIVDEKDIQLNINDTQIEQEAVLSETNPSTSTSNEFNLITESNQEEHPNEIENYVVIDQVDDDYSDAESETDDYPSLHMPYTCDPSNRQCSNIKPLMSCTPFRKILNRSRVLSVVSDSSPIKPKLPPLIEYSPNFY